MRSHKTDSIYTQSVDDILIKAKIAITEQYPVIIEKNAVPSSGDKRDYYSQGPYWWPNPDTEDGLPYINRDGPINPESQNLDNYSISKACGKIRDLSLAALLFKDTTYSNKANEIITAWFINPSTRMNPNLNYAQAIPGKNNGKGRSTGLIDGYVFIDMIEYVSLLETEEMLPKATMESLREWFSNLLLWYLESNQGKEASNAMNNIGTAYDVQIAYFAYFTNQVELAKTILSGIPDKRLFKQIEPNGEQPQELRRTNSFSYSQYNLTHLIDAMILARRLGLNIDRENSSDGRSFYKAVDYLCNYVGDRNSEWPYEQIRDWDIELQNWYKDLYRIATNLEDPKGEYMKIFRQNQRIPAKDIFWVLYFREN